MPFRLKVIFDRAVLWKALAQISVVKLFLQMLSTTFPGNFSPFSRVLNGMI